MAFRYSHLSALNTAPAFIFRVQESGRELPGCHHSGRHAGDADDIPVARPKWLFTRARGGYIDGKEKIDLGEASRGD